MRSAIRRVTGGIAFSVSIFSVTNAQERSSQNKDAQMDIRPFGKDKSA